MANNPISGTITGTAAALGEIQGTAGQPIQLKYVTSGSETIGLSSLIDGTTYTAALRPIDSATGAAASSSALGNGTYHFDVVKGRTIKITASGSSDTKTVNWVVAQ